MVSFTSWLLPMAVSFLCSSLVSAVPVTLSTSSGGGDFASHISKTTAYPSPNAGNVIAHDPNIVEHNGYFYMFKGGVSVPIHRATNMDGPWESIGTVLDGPSIIDKKNASRPWAPTTVYYNNKFYCFYAVSQGGSRNSAIGVASTSDVEGTWTDHGALINTGVDEPDVAPYTETNAIDPSFIVDVATKKPHLVYGSYWDGIWSLPLSDDLTSIIDYKDPSATHLAAVPDAKWKPIEGSFMTHHGDYYYLWFSHGKCCNFEKGFPAEGDEYSIRVGRSKNIAGPFVDKDGNDLLQNGGTVVYGSNHGSTYAPGGLGVMPAADTDGARDVLYYHYLNVKDGYAFGEAQLGWNHLEYENGWPVAVAATKTVYAKGAKTSTTN